VPRTAAGWRPVAASGLRAPARDVKLDGITGNKNTVAGIADSAQSVHSTLDVGSKIPAKFWLRADPRTVPARPPSRPLRLPLSLVVRAVALDTGSTALDGTADPAESRDTAVRHNNVANVRPLPDTPGCNTGPVDTGDERVARNP